MSSSQVDATQPPHVANTQPPFAPSCTLADESQTETLKVSPLPLNGIDKHLVREVFIATAVDSLLADVPQNPLYDESKKEGLERKRTELKQDLKSAYDTSFRYMLCTLALLSFDLFPEAQLMIRAHMRKAVAEQVKRAEADAALKVQDEDTQDGAASPTPKAPETQLPCACPNEEEPFSPNHSFDDSAFPTKN